jgi:hypothetical protein
MTEMGAPSWHRYSVSGRKRASRGHHRNICPAPQPWPQLVSPFAPPDKIDAIVTDFLQDEERRVPEESGIEPILAPGSA